MLQEVNMDDYESDYDDYSDHELPLSSISDSLVLTNNSIIVNSDIQNSSKYQDVADITIKKFECDICGDIFFKRSEIIKHFRTTLCYPESTFYSDFCSEYYLLSNGESSRFHNNNVDNSESNSVKEIYNYKSSPEVEIMKVIKNSQMSFTKNNNLNSKVCFNATSGNTHCSSFKSCKICRKSFKKFSDLKTQQNFHPKRKDFKCNLCNISFKDLNNLEEHNLFHKLFSVPKNFIKTQNPKKYYVCSRCSKVFHKRSEITSHIFSDHQEDYYTYSCDTCANLYHPKEFILHLNKNPFKCEVCPKTYSTLYRLHQHYKWHLGINKFACQYCTKVFSKCSAYLFHERTHNKETPFMCNLCSKWFPVTSNINIHFTPDNKPFVCDICQKVFAQMSSLQSHKIIHTENIQLKDTNYNNLKIQSTNLKEQTRILTSGELHKCNVCHKSFTQLSIFLSHIKTHRNKDLFVNNCTTTQIKTTYVTDYNIFKCDLCLGVFSEQDIFLNHKCTFYKCKFCPKVLSSTFSLKRHYSNVHKIIKPFKCSKCNRSFKETTSFRKHQKMHFQFGEKKS